MTGIRRLTSIILVALCALGGVLLLGGTAQAAVTHEYLSRISEVPATGPHGEAVPFPGPIESADAMTVDSGELYVAEFANPSERLDKFNAKTGAFTSQFPHLPAPYGFANQSVAVGHSTGETEVYDVGDEGSGSEAEGVVVVYNGTTGDVQGYWKGADTPAKDFKCFECGEDGGVTVDDSTNPLTESYVYVSVPDEGVVDVFEPTAGGGERYITQLTGREPGAPFEGLESVAVEQSTGDLLVAETEAVDIFEPAALGQYTLVRRLTDTPNGPFNRVHNVAVDGGDGDIFVGSNGTVYQFGSEGAYLGSLPGGNEGLAVDPASGNVYIAETKEEHKHTYGYIDIYGPSIAVPDVATAPVSSVTHESAILNGTVNPVAAGEATCRFVWGSSTEFGEEAPCEPEGVAEGEAPVPVHATVRGLQPDTTYHYRLEATNRTDGHTNVGEPFQDGEFTTAGPGIEGESTTDIAATSATLDAKIDPNNAPTSYYFQYGTSTSYAGEVPVAPGLGIGSAKGAVEVSQHVQGLQPNTVYHYRVVVVSEVTPGEVEVVEGADETFLTQPPGNGFSLPDGRQWEMVSPPEKRGAEINPIGEFGVIQGSVNGNALTFTTNVPTEANPQGYTEQAQELAVRGSQGWSTSTISVPHGVATGAPLGYGQEYRAFSEDLSVGVVHPLEGFDPSLSGEASEQTAYLRTNYLNANIDEPCLPSSMSCYRPLVTGKPGYANVPPDTAFGEEETGEERECSEESPVCGPEIAGAAPDLRHVVLESRVPLSAEGGHLYEWSEGKLTDIAGLLGNAFIVPEGMARHEISDDGSRVVFEVGSEALYMEDTVTQQVLQLNAVQGGSGENSPEPKVQGASSDGGRIFFTDDQQLTADSHLAGGESALYECEIVEEAGKLHCNLSDLTPAEPGEASVSAILGLSEDGSYVYFAASGKLAAGAVQGECGAQNEVALCNLYVRHDGVTRLVAVVSAEDFADWNSPANQSARVSANGRYFAFMSQQDLTGYDTRDAFDGVPDAEVYLYDASTGRLVCASCEPTGARPVGVGDLQEGRLVGYYWANRQFAASLPETGGFRQGSDSLYQDRYLSSSGRLFFNSGDALVPQDVNGTEDVYEYEPPGVGSCATTSPTYSERAAGCVGMVSSGTSAEESAFLDASGTGGDVFFLTAAKLAPQDFDTAQDIYDAHECTAAVPCYPESAVVPPPCDTGDACKPSPTSQSAIFGAPSSATFSGAGNIAPSATSAKAQRKSLSRAAKLTRALSACHRKKRGGRRAACERQARARYARRRTPGARKADKRGGAR